MTASDDVKRGAGKIRGLQQDGKGVSCHSIARIRVLEHASTSPQVLGTTSRVQCPTGIGRSSLAGLRPADSRGRLSHMNMNQTANEGNVPS